MTSPFELNMTVVAGLDSKIYMQLIGEDDKVLVEKTWLRSSASGGRTAIHEMIEFTPRVTAESARLVIFTRDQYHRLTALATENLILLKVGESDIADADNLKEVFALNKPYADQNLKAGKVVVDGGIRCRVDCRLVVELVNQNGEMIARFEEPNIIQASLRYEWVSYEYQVEVKSPTTVRLIIRAQDIFTAEDIAATSMLVRILR